MRIAWWWIVTVPVSTAPVWREFRRLRPTAQHSDDLVLQVRRVMDVPIAFTALPSRLGFTTLENGVLKLVSKVSIM